MKRDMEVARQILQRLEDCPDPMDFVSLAIPDRTPAEIFYHVKLLAQAGLTEPMKSANVDPDSLYWTSLTNEGHEFLDAIRNDQVWGKVKEKAKEQGGALPFEVLKAVAIQFVKSLMGLG